jgi:transcriptional regulator GlxA family with amidase domain
MKKFNVIVFEQITPLDAFGPVQAALSMADLYDVGYFSGTGGMIRMNGNLQIETLPITEIKDGGILMIPGGFGTRKEVNNAYLIGMIKEKAEKSEYVLTVCTGSALLARTGLLDGKKATSNKISFDWVMEQNKKVYWVKKARWVRDGKYYTSAGVSAGIDMMLGFISDTVSPAAAQKISIAMEYVWNKDPGADAFGA